LNAKLEKTPTGVIDLNTKIDPQTFYAIVGSTNVPIQGHQYFVINFGAANRITQLACDTNINEIFFRLYTGAWGTWKSIISNTSSQALHATDALRIRGNNLYLYKGNGAKESIALPSYVPETTPFSLFSEISGRPANSTEYKAGAVVSGISLYATSPFSYYEGGWRTVGHELASSDVTKVGVGTWKLMDIAPNYGRWGLPGTWKRIA